ncbi:MAG: DUF1848 family protein [Nanoarchaeota archaeon]
MIISASRRTDIPAFYSRWFMDKVQKEKCVYYNPYNNHGYELSLTPEDVDVLVFWSKNYIPLMSYLKDLKVKYNLFFHYTITGITNDSLEPEVIDIDKAISNFKRLVELFGPEKVRWRFDPVLFTVETDENYYLQKFKYISDKLKDHTQSCYFSIAHIYKKVKRNFSKIDDINILFKTEKEKKMFSDKLAEIASNRNITLYSCCNDFLINKKIKKSSCIDATYFNKIFNLNLDVSRAPTRDQCNCYKSTDIGVYNTCPHGCIYCYANYNQKKALRNYNEHHYQQEFLGNIELKNIKRIKKDRTNNQKQMNLFK